MPPDLAGEVDNWRNISLDTGPDALVFPSERGTYLSRDNFLRRNIQKKLDEIGLGCVNFQVLPRTQASLGHKEGVDPKVAADQRGHAIGVAIESDLESRREALTGWNLLWLNPRAGATSSELPARVSHIRWRASLQDFLSLLPETPSLEDAGRELDVCRRPVSDLAEIWKQRRTLI